jgi:hypothetical protein
MMKRRQIEMLDRPENTMKEWILDGSNLCGMILPWLRCGRRLHTLKQISLTGVQNLNFIIDKYTAILI